MRFLDQNFWMHLNWVLDLFFVGYGTSSRSLGGGASWSVGGSSSTYVGSSRDYDGDAWISGVSASQGHGSHGLGSSNWSSSRGCWTVSVLKFYLICRRDNYF